MRLALTGRGMIASVGWSAPSACAAIRAGVVRPRELTYFTVLDSETQEEAPLVGHPIRGYTEGFCMVGRWLRLADGALADLLRSQPAAGDAGFWERTGLLVVTPRVNDDRFQDEGTDAEESVREAVLEPLVARLGRTFAAGAVGIGGFGATGTAAALRRASDLVVSGRADRVAILAVDSLLDPLSLAWLQQLNRLKTPDTAVGLMPGEAACCLLVEHPRSARREGSPAPVEIRAAALGREANAPPAPSTGRGLEQTVRQALSASGHQGRFRGELVSDHTGESWRGHEWGMVQHRLLDVLEPASLRLPCVSVGDTGAASGAVGICLAAHLFDRSAAQGDLALVLSSDWTGEVACVAVCAPETEGTRARG